MLSEWCFAQYEAACNRGDMEAAGNYAELFELWQKRGY